MPAHLRRERGPCTQFTRLETNQGVRGQCKSRKRYSTASRAGTSPCVSEVAKKNYKGYWVITWRNDSSQGVGDWPCLLSALKTLQGRPGQYIQHYKGGRVSTFNTTREAGSVHSTPYTTH